MATSLRLVVLLCAVAAVCAQNLLPVEVPIFIPTETQQPSHSIQRRAADKDQSVTLGKCLQEYSTLYDTTLDIPGGFFQSKKHQIIFPADSSYPEFTISCIQFTDLLRNGKNAEITLTHGGVANQFAIINFKSQRGQPIKYKVQIYGYYY